MVPFVVLAHFWNNQSLLQLLRQSSNLLPQATDLQLPDPIINTHLPNRGANGVMYDGFPPLGLETHNTMSWIYMLLILQAANNGTPVVDLILHPDLHLEYDQFLSWLRNIPSLSTLEHLGKCLAARIMFLAEFKKPS